MLARLPRMPMVLPPSFLDARRLVRHARPPHRASQLADRHRRRGRCSGPTRRRRQRQLRSPRRRRRGWSDEHRAGSGGHGGGLQRLLRVWEAWEGRCWRCTSPMFISSSRCRAAWAPPRPAPSEILAPPPPPPELPAWAEVSDGHDAALASAAERALLGAADLRGKLCAIARAARRMSVSVPPLSPRYEALLVAVEAHKELQTCRAWHSVARDVHAERIRVVAADAARRDCARGGSSARRGDVGDAGGAVGRARGRDARGRGGEADGFAAREATRKSLVANKSVHGVPRSQ